MPQSAPARKRKKAAETPGPFAQTYPAIARWVEPYGWVDFQRDIWCALWHLLKVHAYLGKVIVFREYFPHTQFFHDDHRSQVHEGDPGLVLQPLAQGPSRCETL
jgi:hypothetical protein